MPALMIHQVHDDRSTAPQRLNSERLATASPPHRSDVMKLVPIRPPGRSTRKTRAFALEICELRAQGYTFEAIREALAAAGIHVSNATVRREAARIARHEVRVVPAAIGLPGDRPMRHHRLRRSPTRLPRSRALPPELNCATPRRSPKPSCAIRSPTPSSVQKEQR